MSRLALVLVSRRSAVTAVRRPDAPRSRGSVRSFGALAALVSGLSFIGSAVPAVAHGGQYQGPGGEIPPDSRDPTDPPPPGEGGGGGTPPGEGGGGPTTGGGGPDGGGSGGDGTGERPGGGGTPPGGGNPPGGGSRTPTTGRRSAGLSDWTSWWHCNDDSILAIRRRVRERASTAPVTSGTGALGGASRNAIRPVTIGAVASQVIPALRKLAEDAQTPADIRSAAAIALAKGGDVPSLGLLLELARTTGTSKDERILSEGATLAVGILGKDAREARDELLSLAEDEKRNGTYVRPFAAIALSLLSAGSSSAPSPAGALVRIAERKEPSSDAASACLWAAGRLADDEATAAILAGLARSAGAKAWTAGERPWAIQALGRAAVQGGKADVPSFLIALLRADDTPAPERRSAVIALGRIAARGGADSARASAPLLTAVAEARDDQERHYAILALGRIGASSAVEASVRSKAESVLSAFVSRDGRAAAARPFAAIALGVSSAGRIDAGQRVSEDDVRRPLRDAFRTTKEPRARAAFAVASGLARDPAALPAILQVLGDRHADPVLRGYCALAAGLVGDPSAREPVREALHDVGDRHFRTQAAVAAALLGDARAVEDLVAILTTPDESQYFLGTAALALGAIGDERALEPLLRVASGTEDAPELTRALAVVALGNLADRRDVPVLAPVVEDVEYRGLSPCFSELLTIL